METRPDPEMKNALLDDQLVLATPDAPATATCPHCGGAVKLRSRQGTWFWRHVRRPIGGCRPQQTREPEPGQADAIVNTRDRVRWTRQIGDLIIELQPGHGGHHLTLRSPGVEMDGRPVELVVHLAHVRSLARALLDAAADLTGTVVGWDQDEGLAGDSPG